MLDQNQRMIKSLFDYGIGFFIFLSLIVPIMILVIISTYIFNRFGLYAQERIGKNGKPFIIFKIRSLHDNESQKSKFGSFIRKHKLDEWPQVINVLNGDMSLVGPRPDLLGFADQLKGENKIILSIKPGITGPASIRFKNEEFILSKMQNPKKYAHEVIWPEKVRINKEYVSNWSLSKDICCLWDTIFMKKTIP